MKASVALLPLDALKLASPLQFELHVFRNHPDYSLATLIMELIEVFDTFTLGLLWSMHRMSVRVPESVTFEEFGTSVSLSLFVIRLVPSN